MKLSIIIVNYNTCELLKRCIETVFLYRPMYLDTEIFVVDNASLDGSVSYLQSMEKQVNVIYSKENLGFARANNMALKSATGDYILLLNPDTELTPDALDLCIEKMESDHSIGMLGCKVLLPDGTLDLACRRGFPTLFNSFCKFSHIAAKFPKSKWATGYNLTYLDEEESCEVDSIVGAFMLTSRGAFTEIGLMDESFFMYGEDLDWCFRAKQLGYRVYYYADAYIIHHKRASSTGNANANHEFYNSMKIFFHKNYKDRYGALVHKALDKAVDILETRRKA